MYNCKGEQRKNRRELLCSFWRASSAECRAVLKIESEKGCSMREREARSISQLNALICYRTAAAFSNKNWLSLSADRRKSKIKGDPGIISLKVWEKGLEIGASEDFVTEIWSGIWVTDLQRHCQCQSPLFFLTFRCIRAFASSWQFLGKCEPIRWLLGAATLNQKTDIETFDSRVILLTSGWWSGGESLKISGLKDHLSCWELSAHQRPVLGHHHQSEASWV